MGWELIVAVGAEVLHLQRTQIQPRGTLIQRLRRPEPRRRRIFDLPISVRKLGGGRERRSRARGIAGDGERAATGSHVERVARNVSASDGERAATGRGGGERERSRAPPSTAIREREGAVGSREREGAVGGRLRRPARGRGRRRTLAPPSPPSLLVF